MSEHIASQLVDRRILGFIDWKKDLHSEDVKEFGKIIKRHDIHECYRMYKDFQSSKAVVEKSCCRKKKVSLRRISP